MDTVELLKKVRKIELKARGMINQIFSGEYHSAFKGRGMTFSEVREYLPGDDIRTIDWNVTARFNHPYVKIYEEERELNVLLLVDVSHSEAFGTKEQYKRELLAELSAVLAFSAMHNNDKTGVIFFSDRIEKYIPPKKGRSHSLRIIRELLTFRPKGKGTDIKLALNTCNNVVKRRSIVFVLSDFLTEGYEDTLSLTARKHDLIGLRVFDKRERELPRVGLLRVVDPENGDTRWINTWSPRVRRNYNKRAMDFEKKLNETFVRAGVDLAQFGTGESVIVPLIGLFKKRIARKR